MSFFFICYWFRPDAFQAIHWWPLTLWTPVILMPWASPRPWRLWKPILATLAIWLAMLYADGDVHIGFEMPRDSESLLVVSLNCAGGEVAAAREAFEQGGIVLLQEVGSKDEFVEEALRHGYRHVAWSVDNAIFSHQPLTDIVSKRDYVAATTATSGSPIRVVSLRLHPPMFRLDLWNPECWSAYAADTEARRTRFAEIAQEAQLGDRWIVGGDFNATNPRIVNDLYPKATEAKRAVGRSWIGTGTNVYPFAPVDQLWSLSPGWSQAWVVKTKHSDHRMVVGETESVY